MLAVSLKDYALPQKMEEDGRVVWILEHHSGDELKTGSFNFTIPLDHDIWNLMDGWNTENDRLTFHYFGARVKPSGRSLRKFGSEVTSKIVSILSQCQYPSDFEKRSKLVDEIGSIILDCECRIQEDTMC